MANEWPFEFPGAYWIDEQEEQAVLDVLRNGSLFRYYGLGEPSYVDKLEEQACEFYGVKHALAVNSGTGALITCLNNSRYWSGFRGHYSRFHVGCHRWRCCTSGSNTGAVRN